MNEEQMNQLRSLPFPAFYYMGMDDELQFVSLEVDKDSPVGASYVITYSNGMGGEAQIYGCNGGVGDIMPGEKQVEFSNFLYGGGKAEVYPDGSEEGVKFRAHWIGNWKNGAYYSFSGKNLGERFIQTVVDGLIELE